MVFGGTVGMARGRLLWVLVQYVYSRRQGIGIVVMKKCFFRRWLDGVAAVR